jgi:hypothetical protein
VPFHEQEKRRSARGSVEKGRVLPSALSRLNGNHRSAGCDGCMRLDRP